MVRTTDAKSSGANLPRDENGERLKQSLKKLDKNELSDLIFELAALRKENREWLAAKLRGNDGIDETVSYYKKKIHEGFYGDERIHLKEARRAISDFRRISAEPGYLLELMIFYVETGIRMENEFGDLYEQFYASIESMFEDIIGLLDKHPELALQFRPWLKAIVDNSAGGTGIRWKVCLGC